VSSSFIAYFSPVAGSPRRAGSSSGSVERLTSGLVTVKQERLKKQSKPKKKAQTAGEAFFSTLNAP
jgi:hypothetical protein